MRLIQSLIAMRNEQGRKLGEIKLIDFGWIGEPAESKLGDRDSNPDPTVQSRVPYHWTISQYAIVNRHLRVFPEPAAGFVTSKGDSTGAVNI